MQNFLPLEESAQSVTAPPAALELETTPEVSADAMTAEELQHYLMVMRRLIRQRTLHSYGILGVVALLPLIVVLPFVALPRTFPVWYLLFNMLSVLALLALVLGRMWSRNRGLRHTLMQWARMGGVYAVGPLVDMFQNTASPQDREMLRDALTTLLPQMKASDAALLTARQRGYLLKSLRVNAGIAFHAERRDRFCLAILKALEQIGDEQAVSVVETIAATRPRTRRQQRIKQAAIDCLPALRQNSGTARAAQTLLRASQPENTAPNTLLRPAAATPETAPNELLRAAEAAQ